MRFANYLKITLISLMMGVLMGDSGCSLPMHDMRAPGFGGQDVVTVHLPFEEGYRTQCVQGPGGEYSHRYNSTYFDVDFDTPNDRDDAVYMPIPGTVYVHDDPSAGFGIHVNIDLNDGTYIVVAHLAAATVTDGQTLWAGELLGYEGSTGFSSGDHVHIGRHRGDPKKDAEQGTSIEGLAFMVAGNDGRMKEVNASDMQCDLFDGQTYTSVLPAEPMGENEWNDIYEDDPPDDENDEMVIEEDDGRVMVCLKRQALDPAVNALRLYTITESGMDASEPFYEEGTEAFEVYGIGHTSNNWSSLCSYHFAADHEFIALNGFAYIGPYLGQNADAYDQSPYWRHFVPNLQPQSAMGGAYIDMYIHTDTDGDGKKGNDHDRDCYVDGLMYNDVNQNGSTDFNSLQVALVCP